MGQSQVQVHTEITVVVHIQPYVKYCSHLRPKYQLDPLDFLQRRDIVYASRLTDKLQLLEH